MPRETANRMAQWVSDNLAWIVGGLAILYAGYLNGTNEALVRDTQQEARIVALEKRADLQEKMAAAYVVSEKEQREFHNCIVRHFDKIRDGGTWPSCELNSPGQ